MSYQVLEGDSVEVMAAMDEASVDAICTDPPYGLEFMGKEWDKLGDIKRANRGTQKSWKRPESENSNAPKFQNDAPAFDLSAISQRKMQAWHEAWAREALRVLKPGGHLLAAGGTRTFHRLVCAIEDAGFEIRDTVSHFYGSGFPKSKSMREIGRPELGSALKPAHEPWTLARKPLAESSIARQVLATGTGAINVDGCRIQGTPEATRFDPSKHSHAGWRMDATGEETAASAAGKAGRWPANLLLSHHPACDGQCVNECPVGIMDGQSGHTKSREWIGAKGWSTENSNEGWRRPSHTNYNSEGGFNDKGGASRFFKQFDGVVDYSDSSYDNSEICQSGTHGDTSEKKMGGGIVSGESREVGASTQNLKAGGSGREHTDPSPTTTTSTTQTTSRQTTDSTISGSCPPRSTGPITNDSKKTTKSSRASNTGDVNGATSTGRFPSSPLGEPGPTTDTVSPVPETASENGGENTANGPTPTKKNTPSASGQRSDYPRHAPFVEKPSGQVETGNCTAVEAARPKPPTTETSNPDFFQRFDAEPGFTYIPKASRRERNMGLSERKEDGMVSAALQNSHPT